MEKLRESTNIERFLTLAPFSFYYICTLVMNVNLRYNIVKKIFWYERVCTIFWLGKVVDGYAIVGCGIDVGLGYLGLLIQFG